MMLFVLRHFRDGVHKVDGVGKIIELEGAFDVLLFELPFRNLLQALLRLICFDQVSHNRTTSNTPKSFCNGESDLLFHSSLRLKDRESGAGSSRRRRPPPRNDAPASTNPANPPGLCSRHSPLPLFHRQKENRSRLEGISRLQYPP